MKQKFLAVFFLYILTCNYLNAGKKLDPFEKRLLEEMKDEWIAEKKEEWLTEIKETWLAEKKEAWLAEKQEEWLNPLKTKAEKLEQDNKKLADEIHSLKNLKDERDLSISSYKNFCQTFKYEIQRERISLLTAEGLNATEIINFYQPTFPSLLAQEEYFNSIDSLNQFNLALEPYGFVSSFDQKDQNFKLETLGIGASGNIRLKDAWILGTGAGYWHSNFKSGKEREKTKINSIYFGPQATYLFNQAYVQLMLNGIYNLYDIQSEFIEKRSNEHSTWDIMGRVSGGVDIKTPFLGGSIFFIQPNMQFSYMVALPHDYEENSANDVKISIKNGYSDFFRSNLGLKLWKDFYSKDFGFFIPSFSIGWIYTGPLSKAKTVVICEDKGNEKSNSTENDPFSNKRYPKSNQLYISGELTTVLKKGLLFALAFEANIAEIYPVYKGSFRFEIDW